MEISQEPICVRYVVDEAMSLTQPLSRGKGVTVVLDPESDAELFVMADRQRLLQIVINLISNGVKYNSEGGSVNIGYTADSEGSAKIVVQDTGKGIGKDLAHRVFMPFDRLGIEQYDQIEGTGLGLTLSKSLVEAMNGHISFTSEIGVGTVFTVELLQAQPPVIEVEHHTVPTPKLPKSDRIRLLYIEDNESNIALMKSLVAARPQWELSIAITGGDGLKQIASAPPDLLLLDLDLPDTSGYDVLIRLRADYSQSDLPVLIVSADATQDRIERLLAAGANGYITKPFNVRDLLNQITSSLDPEVEHAA